MVPPMDTPTRPNTAWQAMMKDAASRRQTALQMRQAGKSLREIGEFFGVTRERARQMVAAAIRDNQR